MRRMQELKSSQERRFSELSQHQSQKIQEIIAKLAAHFKSEETIKSFAIGLRIKYQQPRRHGRRQKVKH